MPRETKAPRMERHPAAKPSFPAFSNAGAFFANSQARPQRAKAAAAQRTRILPTSPTAKDQEGGDMRSAGFKSFIAKRGFKRGPGAVAPGKSQGLAVVAELGL